MLDTATQAEINKWLALSYGITDDGANNYRLVYGPTQWENRWGEFEEWQGRIFIRRFKGVKYLPKYQEHGEVYILEKLVINFQPEILVGVKVSYEPIWIFDQKKDGKVIHPWLSAIQFFMLMAVDGPKMAATRMIREQRDSYDQEAQLFSEELRHEAENLAYGGVGVL